MCIGYNRRSYAIACNHIGDVTCTRQAQCDELDLEGKPFVFTDKGFQTWDLQYRSFNSKPLGHPKGSVTLTLIFLKSKCSVCIEILNEGCFGELTDRINLECGLLGYFWPTMSFSFWGN